MSASASSFVRSARSLIGVRWQHQGRTERGVDCIGLVLLAGLKVGVDFFRVAGVPPIGVYGRRADPKLYELVRRCCVSSALEEPGVLLLFRFRGESHARHFGILTDAGTVIHAECKTRREVIEHGYRMHWRDWTHSRWRLPGIEYGA